MLWCTVVLLALSASVQGRAVNISNTWVLPEEGFPVFYRYFRDRISWYEADAVCQFHHANLVTVDTTAQYDAVRAYLKELDISSAVWVGLIRSNPDGDFTWTDYRGLSGDGYWSSAPDARVAPLCAAADPAADYRWEARACGGPTVASFICELPVPQWALGNEGCMVRALPALTILYLPESAAVQLTADCGLAGVKRVQCTGNVKREDLLKDLSCAEENEPSSTPSLITTWSVTSDTSFTDQDTTNEDTTEQTITTVHREEVNQSNLNKATPPLQNLVLEQEKSSAKHELDINLVAKFPQKNINLDLAHNNNLQSNHIPKLVNEENFLTLEQSEKLEDEKHMHHKMLHDELARHGNFETIFTQPTDHFIPPLVMAKARISDDMTVLSLAEKHAQQLAEQRFGKHKILNEHFDHLQKVADISITTTTTEGPSTEDIVNKPLVIIMQSNKSKDSGKKDKNKSALPKKYNVKYDVPKARNVKMIDNKIAKIDKITDVPITQTESLVRETELTKETVTQIDKSESKDDSIELTVILKEPGVENQSKMQNFSYDNDEPKLEVIRKNNELQEKASSTKNNKSVETLSTVETKTESIPKTTMTHEIIKITILNDNNDNQTPTVFEITTRTPVFKDGGTLTSDPQTLKDTFTDFTTHDLTDSSITAAITTPAVQELAQTTVKESTTSTSPLGNEDKKANQDRSTVNTVIDTLTTKNEHSTVDTATLKSNKLADVNKPTTTVTTSPSTVTTSIPVITTEDRTDDLNSTEIPEDEYEKNSTETSESIDDYQSPLLSAANEPLHRPNRSRRPQPANHLKKFNPFRILG